MIKDFVYLRPRSVTDALAMLAQYGEACKVICGGQSILILMRQGLVAPDYLIDIKHLAELDFIDFDATKGLRIGAATTHRKIEKSAVIRRHYPVLAEMEEHLASIQTRNWGTIGGNLCHADPAGDPAPVLIALKASLRIADGNGERTIPVEEFFVDYFETVLGQDGLLLEIMVPILPPRTAAAYEKFTVIESDHAIVSVACSVTLDEDHKRCKEARVVLGAAAPIPKRATKAEDLLVGGALEEGMLDAAAQAASGEAEPIADIHASETYRRDLVKALTKRMIRKAWKAAEELAA